MNFKPAIQFLIVLVACGIASGMTTARSETTHWTAVNDLWSDPFHWSNGVPTESVSAVINNGGMAAVQTADGAAYGLFVGTEEDASGTLVVRFGRELVVDGSFTRIGQFGVGSLYILDGGALISQSPVRVETTTKGETSTAIVEGEDSSWHASDEFVVAPSGRGTVTVSDGGQLEIGQNFRVGVNALAEGQVVVQGQGSHLSAGTLTESPTVRVGQFGAGGVSVEGGGTADFGEGSTVELAWAAGSGAQIRIGAGEAPGIFSASFVEGGFGDARIIFDHDHDNHYFTSNGQADGEAVEIAGSTQLEHIGIGATVIEGEHAFTGATTIEGGTLVINGTSAESVVTVNAGGTLAGHGEVGDVIVNSGTLSPGHAVGTLTMGDLTLDENAILEFQLSIPETVGEGVNDLIAIDGDLVLDGVIDLSHSQGLEPGSYTLMTYSGSLVNNGPAVAHLPPGLGAELITHNAGEVRMLVSELAGTRYVATDGSDTSNACLDVATPCQSIAHAIEMALDHDDIQIAAGVYTETLTLDKPLSLLGEGRDETIIQAHAVAGEADDRVIMIPEGTDSVTLAALSIQHGYTTGTGPVDGRGGGIHNRDADLVLVDVAIRDNTGTVAGGGLYHDGGEALFDGVVFTDNASSLGAGISTSGSNASLTILNTVFKANVANSNGGGIRLANQASAELFNVVFSGNSSGHNGGAMDIGHQVETTVVNSTFSGNVADSGGGAIANGLGTITDLVNVIIWNNEADGDSFSVSASIYNLEHSITSISHSLVANSGGSGQDWVSEIGADGGNNLDADPLFIAPVDPVDAPTVSGDLRLTSESPAIDAGDNDAFDAGLPDIDLAGYARLLGLAIDLGAYETPSSRCPAAGVVHVDQQASQPQDGLTWASAFIDLQDALRVTEPCQVWVAKGAYLPTDHPSDRLASFTIVHDGIQVYGGFAGGETSLDERDWEANETVLSGDINASGDLLGNAYNVVVVDGQAGDNITNETVIDGFVITGGHGNHNPHNRGGGMVCRGQGSGNECSPSINNVTFTRNEVAERGGGMFNDGRYGGNASPVLTNVVFYENWGGTRGGGMLNDGREGNSHPVLNQVLFTDNVAEVSGGGMMNDGRDGSTSPVLNQVTFKNNSANTGGGMAIEGPAGEDTPTLTSVTFIDNTAAASGGGMSILIEESGSSNPVLTNVAFIGNSAGRYGGGISSFVRTGSSDLVLNNALFSGNHADSGGGFAHRDSNSDGAHSVLTNVTFSGNVADSEGGAILNYGFAVEVEIRNSILWINFPNSISNLGPAHLTASHSLAYGCKPEGTWLSQCGEEIDGSNLPDADPAFIEPADPTQAPSTYGNLRLAPASPVIAAGNNEYVEDVSTDLDGNPRVTGKAVDLGAFELADSVFGDRFEQP